MITAGILEKTIERAISTLKVDDELAYLSLTSKIEQPLRDKIAFIFYRKFKGNILVCREWKSSKPKKNQKRIDLALINKKNKKVKTLVEFKAYYLFDYSRVSKKLPFIKYLKKDQNRMKKFADANTECLMVLLLTDPQTAIPGKLEPCVKYFKGIKSHIKKTEGKNYDLKKIIADVDMGLSEINKRVKYGVCDINSAYSIPVKLHYWIIGPFRKKGKKYES